MVFILIFFLFVLHFVFEDPCTYRKRTTYSLFFSGVISKKLRDPDHKYECAIIVNDEEYILYSLELYTTLSVGDAIIKRDKDYKFTLIKNGDTSEFYNDCGGKQVLDN